MAQSWHDLLFAHWPVPAAALRPLLSGLVPEGLDLDERDGSAWIGVVPFTMSGVRLRGLPPVPGASRFPELNVRTYVTMGDRPGVWFFSLDAASRLAVAVARRWFHLPYHRARMSATPREDEGVRYSHLRTHPGSPPAEFGADYHPTGPVTVAESGSLDAFLTERYCLYTADEAGTLWRGEIHHEPWPLQPAEAYITRNTMTQPLGIGLQGPPLLHFARRLDVVVWTLERAGT